MAWAEKSGTQLGSRGRVLVADDQQPVLFALQMLLSGSGFSTETVTHPSRVLRALESESFDAE